MKLKKIITTVTLAALVIAAVPQIASAHGGRHHSTSGSTKGTSYALCTVEDCNKTSRHKHSGKYYYGHYANDGHDYHAVCELENCSLSSVHKHSGTNYFGHCTTGQHKNHL